MDMVARLAEIAEQEARESAGEESWAIHAQMSQKRSSGPTVLTEGVNYWTPARIKELGDEYAGMKFSSEKSARANLAQQLRHNDDGPRGSLFPDHVENMIKEIVASAPVFEHDGFRLGEFCPWRYIEIRREDGRYIHDTAQAQREDDYDIIKIKNYDLDALLGPAEQDSYLKGSEGQRCQRLADEIKNNGYFTAIIVDVTDPNEMFIIEGQHRARACRLLGFYTVAAHGIRYDVEDD